MGGRIVGDCFYFRFGFYWKLQLSLVKSYIYCFTCWIFIYPYSMNIYWLINWSIYDFISSYFFDFDFIFCGNYDFWCSSYDFFFSFSSFFWSFVGCARVYGVGCSGGCWPVQVHKTGIQKRANSAELFFCFFLVKASSV